MSIQFLLDQLLALSDLEEQKYLLHQSPALLNDHTAHTIKKKADKLLGSNVQSSLEIAEVLAYMAELTANPLYQALGFLAEANARSIGLGEYQLALECYDHAAKIYQENNCPADQAKAQVAKIWSLACLSRYDEAIETGKWASHVLEAHQEWLPLARLTENLGIIRGRLGEDEAALALFDRARALYTELVPDGKSQIPGVEINRTVVLTNLGQFDAAIQAGKTAYEILSEEKAKIRAAHAQENLAVTYFVLGRYNEALENLDQVQEIFLADGRKRSAIRVELLVSDCLLQLRRFADVLEKCQQVREHFTELGTRLEVGQAMRNEAVAYIGLQQYEKAWISLNEAQNLFELEGNEIEVTLVRLEKATVLHDQHKYRESFQLAQDCVEMFAARDLPLEEAQARLIAARAATSLAEYENAQQLVYQALAISEIKNIQTLLYRSYRLLGLLNEAQNDGPQAFATYAKAVEALEQLRGRMMMEFRTAFVEDKQTAYEDIVSLCLDLDRPLKGLEYVERAKSRVLVELISHRVTLGIQVRNKSDQPLVSELMNLRAKRDQLYRRWERNEEFRTRGALSTDGDLQREQQAVLTLENQINLLWNRLLVRHADYARDAALWKIHTEPIQPYLASDTLVLEYFIARQQLIIFLVTSDSVQVARFPIDITHIQDLLGFFQLNMNAVATSNLAQIPSLVTNAQVLLKQFYALLLKPVHHIFRTYSKLIIVPHGLLHYLPFHAFYDGEAFLLEQHAISYLPGASLLRHCHETPPSTSGFYAFGHSYKGHLPHAVQEARTIATQFDGETFLNDEATVSNLQKIAADCSILHMAVHGDFRPDNPLFSGLALADGWLTTLDVFNLQLKASLVTLSACQTGQNVIGGGDELLGLMRAFFASGASSLLLSLWAVEDRSTAQIMMTFYDRLADGWDKSVALRYAQQQLIHRRVDDNDELAEAYTHPYFWAPFFLVGHSGPLSRS